MRVVSSCVKLRVKLDGVSLQFTIFNDKMEHEVQTFYGNRLRVRACGIALRDESLLLINHAGLSRENFWSPPGGGIQFDERSTDALMREFREETGLIVEPQEFLFACELVKPPLHAIELFFSVKIAGGQLKLGGDPEPGSPAIIKGVRFMTWQEIEALPTQQLHGSFQHVDHPSKIAALRGFFTL
jgi:8-oxo-dGTP diphosphatase